MELVTEQKSRGYLPFKVRVSVLIVAVVLGPVVTALVSGFRADALRSIPAAVVAAVVLDQLYAWIDRRDRRG